MPFQALLRSASLRAAAARSVRATPSTATTNATRPFTYAATARLPYKDTQDRDSINTGTTEATKSGRDQDAARDSEAFDPSKTRPESERASGGPELDVTGADQGVSKPQGDKPGAKGGAGKETRKGGKSGGASSTKAGNV